MTKNTLGMNPHFIVLKQNGNLVLEFEEVDTSGPAPRGSGTVCRIHLHPGVGGRLLAELEACVPLSQRVSGSVETFLDTPENKKN